MYFTLRHWRSTKTLSTHRPLPSADIYTRLLHHACEGLTGKLSTLIGIEDITEGYHFTLKKVKGQTFIIFPLYHSE